VERVAWTDDRIDDAFASLREEMRELRTELRAEMRDMRSEMREMRTDLHGQISAGQRQLTTIGWGIAAALLAQLLAFVITQS
jgi:ABC-type branched-subunit amino acid transport system ATPase component